MSSPYNPRSRTTLLDTTFWEVLPSHYDKIQMRWERIAHLYTAAKYDPLPSDRDGAANSLKAELELLEHDVQEYWSVAQSIKTTDIAGIYEVTGSRKDEALQKAKENLNGLKSSVRTMEDKVHEIRAGDSLWI